jgi:hypothetical protein
VTPDTQGISDSDSDNGSDEQQEEHVNVRLGGLSTKVVQKNMGFTRNILGYVWSSV